MVPLPPPAPLSLSPARPRLPPYDQKVMSKPSARRKCNLLASTRVLARAREDRSTGGRVRSGARLDTKSRESQRGMTEGDKAKERPVLIKHATGTATRTQAQAISYIHDVRWGVGGHFRRRRGFRGGRWGRRRLFSRTHQLLDGARLHARCVRDRVLAGRFFKPNALVYAARLRSRSPATAV